MGGFFSHFATYLREQGLDVSKVNLNGGDVYFYKHQPAYAFKDRPSKFSGWLESLIDTKKIDAVICFGDCREHHQIAAKLCDKLGLSFYVFEEGYLRPDYVTFEKHGINGYSKLPLALLDELPVANDHPLPTYNKFSRMSWAAIQYYIACVLKRHEFPYYQHYRKLTAWQEAAAWLNALYQKYAFKGRDKKIEQRALTSLSDQYFLVTLQVHKDSQVTVHSDYTDVVDFIEEVIESFAKSASPKHHLIIKHHPLDRGHRQYDALAKRLAENFGVAGRVLYGCDMHLPSLIKHSIGMVTINSTTGLQSIYHHKPVKTMGHAVYDMAGLTSQCSLDEFWQAPEAVDYDLYLRFRQLLLNECQLNGSFYGLSPWMQQSMQVAAANNTQDNKTNDDSSQNKLVS